MKRILLLLFFICAYSQTLTADVFCTYNSTPTYVESSMTVAASLDEEEYGMKLFLYKDGSCVIRYKNNNTQAGTYNITGNRIYFDWGEGFRSQQGTCTFRNGKLEYVSVEGYTFKQRIVVPRR